MSRTKWFNCLLPEHCFELDENGIPAIAYWNTQGDEPVSARQLVNHFAWEVVYEYR